MKQSLRAGLIVLVVAGLITGGVALAIDDGGTAVFTAAADEEGTAGAGLREHLQPLVDEGTISSDQADAVAEHLEGMRRGHHRNQGHRAGFRAFGAAADFLGLTADELRDALADGSTLAEVAADNNSSGEALVEHLTGLATERLDEALASGRITEEQKAAALERMTEKLTDAVNNGLPERPGDRRGGPHHRCPHHRGPGHFGGPGSDGAPPAGDARFDV